MFILDFICVLIVTVILISIYITVYNGLFLLYYKIKSLILRDSKRL